MSDVKRKPSATNLLDENREAMMNQDIHEASRNQDEYILFIGTEDHFCELRRQLTQQQREFEVVNIKLVTTSAQVADECDLAEQPNMMDSLIHWRNFYIEGLGVIEVVGSANSGNGESVPDVVTSRKPTSGSTSLSSPHNFPAVFPNKAKYVVNGMPDVLLQQGDCDHKKRKECVTVYSCGNDVHQKTAGSNILQQPELPCDQHDVVFTGFKCSHQNHQDQDAFRCIQCPKKYSSIVSLSNHMNIHTNRFQCNLCQTCCRSKSELVRHTRRHTKEKPFKCQNCGTCFQLNSGLLRHVRRFHSKTFT